MVDFEFNNQQSTINNNIQRGSNKKILIWVSQLSLSLSLSYWQAYPRRSLGVDPSVNAIVNYNRPWRIKYSSK